MTQHTRMSPLTALFLGIFGVTGVGIVSGTAIVMYGMIIVNGKASEVLGFADTTVVQTLKSLPEILEALPTALDDVLSHRRAPEYADQIDVSVAFVADERGKGLHPVLTILNKGEKVVSMLAVRVAALNENGLPIREWTEVVATPIALSDEWRGTLLPGSKRHVVLPSCWRSLPVEKQSEITGVAEISEIRIWEPTDEV